MVASGSQTTIAGSLSCYITGFLLSYRFSQSSGPRRSTLTVIAAGSQSAWSPNANRRAKRLICLAAKGARLDVYSINRPSYEDSDNGG
jgi:hypothetical protein